MGGAGWADAVAALHAVVVLLVVTGGLAGLRWPGLRRVHVPVLAAALAVNVTGSDCPLTALELRLRDRAGVDGYSGGFVGHYLLEPLLGPGSADPSLPGLVLAAAVLPNVVAYGVLVRRVRRRGAHRARPAGQWLVVPRRDASPAGTSRSATSPVASE